MASRSVKSNRSSRFAPSTRSGKRGEQLESFQIGEEEAGDDGTKQFAVKLTMKKSKTSEDVRYIVHGRDPVWVFREEDYKRTLNMENNPEPAPKSKPSSTRSSRAR